jgi:hypothetical protein
MILGAAKLMKPHGSRKFLLPVKVLSARQPSKQNKTH